jgi:hypothetical protein
MRLSSVLVQIATLIVAAGCKENSTCTDGPAPPVLKLAASDACAIIAEPSGLWWSRTSVENDSCARACGNGDNMCDFPTDFIDAYNAANPDAGAGIATDAGPKTCPTAPSVRVACHHDCTGRRTDGTAAPSETPTGIPHYLGTSAYLEAVSVVAFDRLAHELSAHGAPEELILRAKRAAKEELEHAHAVWRIAAKFGATAQPEWPSLATTTVRSLLEIATENAVEGCIRETYGAVVGLFRAASATDHDVQNVMRAIADEECSHAELSWDILRWTLSRLEGAERSAVARAMRATRETLVADITGEMPIAADDAARLGIPSREQKLELLRLVETRAFFLAA